MAVQKAIEGQQSGINTTQWSFDRPQWAFEGTQCAFEQDTMQFDVPQQGFWITQLAFEKAIYGFEEALLLFEGTNRGLKRHCNGFNEEGIPNWLKKVVAIEYPVPEELQNCTAWANGEVWEKVYDKLM